MNIRKIALIALLGMFGLTFAACQEEEIAPGTDNTLNTEGVREGHDEGPGEF